MPRILTARSTPQRWVIFRCKDCNERWPVGDHEREDDPWVLHCPNCLRRGIPGAAVMERR